MLLTRRADDEDVLPEEDLPLTTGDGRLAARSGDAGEPAVRAHLARLYGVDTARWEHVARYDVSAALPDQRPPMGRLEKPVRLGDGLFVCGDHRDTASIQGALVSGQRAARAVLAAS